jgi:pilus assembly protein Flp/PilA
MNCLFLKLQGVILPLLENDEGQDLVEYALVVALIAFGAVAGMGSLASELNTAFNTLSSDLSSALA